MANLFDRILPTFLLALFVCSFLSACSTQEAMVLEPVGQGFKVSVRSDGEEVSEHASRLIHHVSLKPRELIQLRAVADSANVLELLRTRIERDSRGGVQGLRVVSVTAGSSVAKFGLRRNDIITALGKQHARRPREMLSLLAELERTPRVSMTFIRAGMPHKVYLRKETLNR